MNRFENGPKTNIPKEENSAEKIKDRVIAQAALRLANDIVGELVTGRKQYVTEYFQEEIKHRRKLDKAAASVVTELEELYDEVADMYPSPEDLVAYYNKRKSKEN